MIEIEWEKAENCLVIGRFTEEDASFDHAFGTEKGKEYLELDEMKVLVFIDGTEYDITKALTDKERENFQEQLVEYVNWKGYEVSA